MSANPAAPGNSAMARRFHIDHLGRALPEPQCYDTEKGARIAWLASLLFLAEGWGRRALRIVSCRESCG